MISLLLEIVQRLRDETNAVFARLIPVFQLIVDTVFSLRGFTISLKYPPLPLSFEIIFDGGFEIFDILTRGLSSVPFIVAGSIVLDRFKAPGILRQRVMTLDQAAILPIRVILNEGIRDGSPVSLPPEWQLSQLISRWTKLVDFIKVPTFLRGAKALLGSAWGKVVTLVIIALNVIKLLSLFLLLWSYVVMIQKESNWPSLFSGTLSQANKRKKVRVRIRRRIGGVPP